MYNELRKIGMNSICQGKSVEKYIPFKYNQTAVQKNWSKPFYFFICSGTLKKVSNFVLGSQFDISKLITFDKTVSVDHSSPEDGYSFYVFL